MTIWALSDLHLSFGTPSKSMEVFGPTWKDWTKKIEEHWKSCINQDDLVLIAGDISWSSNLREALIDLQWIHNLPGTKLLLKGNHDYWWSSMKKIQEILPSSLHCLHNNAFNWNDCTIGGSRLWDTDEYDFHEIIAFQDNPLASQKTSSQESILEENKKIFDRELLRLKMSLDQLCKDAKHRLVMTHYPPIGLNLDPSQVSTILDAYHIDLCIFGHLHNLNTHAPLFGTLNQTRYLLTSCDYLNFKPIKIL